MVRRNYRFAFDYTVRFLGYSDCTKRIPIVQVGIWARNPSFPTWQARWTSQDTGSKLELVFVGFRRTYLTSSNTRRWMPSPTARLTCKRHDCQKRSHWSWTELRSHQICVRYSVNNYEYFHKSNNIRSHTGKIIKYRPQATIGIYRRGGGDIQK